MFWICLSWFNFMLKVHCSDSSSQTNCHHTNLLKFLVHFFFHVFSSDFLKPPQYIKTVCPIWVQLKMKCRLFHWRRSTHRSQIKESKEKVAESKRKVDQRKVKNPLSKWPGPSKSGRVQEEEGNRKQGWLEEWCNAGESRLGQGKVTTVWDGKVAEKSLAVNSNVQLKLLLDVLHRAEQHSRPVCSRQSFITGMNLSYLNMLGQHMDWCLKPGLNQTHVCPGLAQAGVHQWELAWIEPQTEKTLRPSRSAGEGLKRR